jgi:simple sugar transport system permease protein
MSLGLPSAITGLFQGMLLFFMLAADVLIRYRVRIRSAAVPVAALEAAR